MEGSEEFIIRPAVVNDVPAIIPLVKESWARTYDPAIGEAARREISDNKHIPELFLAEIETPSKDALVAVSGDAIIGHVGGYMQDNNAFYVDHLHVEKGWHGKGVATALMNGLRDHLKSDTGLNPDAIELTVLKGNDRAIAFYFKQGFKDLGEAEGLNGIPAILMRWEI